jgi:hypothetical protein
MPISDRIRRPPSPFRVVNDARSLSDFERLKRMNIDKTRVIREMWVSGTPKSVTLLRAQASCRGENLLLVNTETM